ncbi:MAG: hypothetical protein C4320_03095 [Armatimonadota bacterium]
MKVSVVIVSFNTADSLRRCLAAVEQEHEVIVVDNGSADASVAMVRAEFPAVHLIEAGENLGFGRACNLGAGMATGDLLLFLNSDCYAAEGAIRKLAEVFEDASVSGAGGRLLHPDGTLQNSTAHRMTLSVVLWEQFLLEKVWPIYWTTRHFPLDRPSRTEQVMGACLMTRRPGFPGFDGRFFLYMEDTMLCDQLRHLGNILWVPDAVFTHELGTSSQGSWWKGVARYNRGKELYFLITRGRGAQMICRGLNKIGALLRIVLKPRQASGFWRVFRS